MLERHTILYNSIGFLGEELEAMHTITGLILNSTIYISIGILLEACFFYLYNSSLHPFAKILDVSEGILLLLYSYILTNITISTF